MERFTCMQYHMHNITTPKRIPTAPKNQLCVYWPSLECADDEPRCEEPRAELDFGNVISTLTMRNMCVEVFVLIQESVCRKSAPNVSEIGFQSRCKGASLLRPGGGIVGVWGGGRVPS